MVGKLQQVDVHQQRFTAACGVLQAELVEVFDGVSADAGFTP